MKKQIVRSMRHYRGAAARFKAAETLVGSDLDLTSNGVGIGNNKEIWQNYHVYYTRLQPLILDCVYPLLLQVDAGLGNCFWERHYAGGPHLRVRLFGSASSVEAAGKELIRAVTRYIDVNPSPPLSNYSPEKIRRLLEAEDEATESEDLTYHVNEVLMRPYERLNHRLASDEAARLLEAFLHDSMSLVASIWRSGRPLREEILRLYFAHALLVTGDLARGCVAYKSHWEGFSSLLPVRSIIQRIEEQYALQRGRIHEIMLEVQHWYEDRRSIQDAVLEGWSLLSEEYGERTTLSLKNGLAVTRQAASVEEVRESWNEIARQTVRESEFINTLFQDKRFMASIQFDHSFLRPRVLTNLLYQVVTSAGLPLAEKMSMCYYAHRAAEEHCKCDLTRILEETIQNTISRHSDRLPK